MARREQSVWFWSPQEHGVTVDPVKLNISTLARACSLMAPTLLPEKNPNLENIDVNQMFFRKIYQALVVHF